MPVKRTKQRDLNQKIEQIEQDCENQGLPKNDVLIRRLAHQQVVLDEMEARWLQGEKINQELFWRGMNAMIRLMEKMGLLQGRNSPKSKKEPQTLDEYIQLNGSGR